MEVFSHGSMTTFLAKNSSITSDAKEEPLPVTSLAGIPNKEKYSSKILIVYSVVILFINLT